MTQTEVVRLTNQFQKLDENQLTVVHSAIVGLLPEKVKAPKTEAQNAKAAFSNIALQELLSLSKTTKVVHRLIKEHGIEQFLSDKQRPLFNSVRSSQLLKSPTLVIRCMTDNQFKRFKQDGNKVSPSVYLNILISLSCMLPKTFEKRRKQVR